MIYHIYRHTKNRMPAVFDVQREQPIEGPELLGAAARGWRPSEILPSAE